MKAYERLAQHPQANVNTTTFLGLNRGLTVRDGELNDCENLCSDYYPQLSPCHPRVSTGWQYSGFYHGSISKGTHIYTAAGTKLYCDGEQVEGITLADEGKKLMVSMGAYIAIWPDKVWLNTISGEHGSMGGLFPAEGSATAILSPCTLGGAVLDGGDYNYTVSNRAPTTHREGDYWVDTSGKYSRLMVWSAITKTWEEVLSTYIRIQAEGIGANFEEGDAVRLMAAGGEWIITSTIPPQDTRTRPQLDKLLEASVVVYGKGDDYIIVTGVIDNTCTVGNLQCERRVPDFDYVVESNNRLWGCRYGKDSLTDEFINEIHCCKLGDLKNWEVYEGISTDSYNVSLGSDGPFTGAISVNGTPVFFKQGAMHRISGQMPVQYTMNTASCRGVDAGDSSSLQLADQYMVYKCRDDVLIYSGTFVSIGKVLGQTTLAGDTLFSAAHGTKYFLGLPDGIYVYDTQRRMWHREDGSGIVDMVSTDEALYYIQRSDDHVEILRQSTEAEHAEGQVKWGATFGAYGYDSKTHKYLTRFDLRLQMEKGSEIVFQIQYDHDTFWHPVGLIRGRTVQSFLLPITPRRCDHCQIRLKGTGRAKLLGLARILEQGSDN